MIEIGGDEDIPFDVLAMFERVDNAPKGRDGGHCGAPGRVSLASGERLRSKGQQSIPAGDRLRLEMAGGGGFGDPRERDPERVAEDAANGFISEETARYAYGVVLDAAGNVDETATRLLAIAELQDGPPPCRRVRAPLIAQPRVARRRVRYWRVSWRLPERTQRDGMQPLAESGAGLSVVEHDTSHEAPAGGALELAQAAEGPPREPWLRP